MGLSSVEKEELTVLLEAVCHETVSLSESRRLQALVASCPEAEGFYLAYLHTHAALQWVHRDTPNTFGAIVTASHGQVFQTGRLLAPAAWRLCNSTAAASLAMAVLFYSSFALLVWQMSSYVPPLHEHETTFAVDGTADLPQKSVARLVRAMDCRWEGGKPPRNGDQLTPRLLKLISGMVELEFNDGASTSIEGPAEFELVSAKSGFLHNGKLLAEVPKRAVGFTINTPTAEIVDLGTEFGVEVDSHGTNVHVHAGKVELLETLPLDSSARHLRTLVAGDAVHVSSKSKQVVRIPYQSGGLDSFFSEHDSASQDDSMEHVTSIPLGNLFDDPRGTPLAKAIPSNTFCAIAEMDDLGVDRVLYGGDAVRKITPHLRFDLANLGWQERFIANVCNDAFTDELTSESKDWPRKFGILTRGRKIDEDHLTAEEGIGIHANALITFDLDEIRTAGQINNKMLQFISDRVGIDDHFFGHDISSVHFAAIVSDNTGVMAVIVDGEPAQAAQHNGIWRITSNIGKPVRANGHFVSFRLPISTQARYLTLITASAADTWSYDDGVWSGARLEVQP